MPNGLQDKRNVFKEMSALVDRRASVLKTEKIEKDDYALVIS